MAKKHPPSGVGKPRPNPNDDGAHRHKTEVSGTIEVRGVIQAEPNPSLEQDRKASEEKRDSRDERRLGVEKITLAALVVYSFLTAFIYLANRDAAKAAFGALQVANTSLQLDKRAWIDVKIEIPNPDKVLDGTAIVIPVSVTNTGRTPAWNVEAKMETGIYRADYTLDFTGMGHNGIEPWYGVLLPNSPPVSIDDFGPRYVAA